MGVEEGDPLDKVLKSRNCTICSPAALLSMSRGNLLNLEYTENNVTSKLNPDEIGAIEQLQKYVHYLKQQTENNRIDYWVITDEDFDDFRVSSQGELLMPPTRSPTGTINQIHHLIHPTNPNIHWQKIGRKASKEIQTYFQ